MTNSVAALTLALALSILIADATVFRLDILVLIGKELLRLLDWLAFWR